MAQNVLVCYFDVESEAYQAITELKSYENTEKSIIAEAALVRKENNTLKVLDGLDTGARTGNDAAVGGLVGAIFGILGGPIGILLGGSLGVLIGAAFDGSDASEDASILERIAQKMDDNDLAIIALTDEEDESILDEKLSKFQVIIARFDAAVVAAEVEKARIMEKELARQAREDLRNEKKAARKQKAEEKKA